MTSGRRSATVLGPLLAATLCCQGRDPGPEPWQCTVDGRCEGVENGANCAADCDSACPADLASLGPERVFVIQELRVPRTVEDSQVVGADLDGDGLIENRWGRVVRMIDNVLEPGGPQDDALARGELVLLARLRGDPTVEGARVAVQILQQGHSAEPLREGGTNEVSLTPPEPEPAWACGRVQGGAFHAGPAQGTMLAPLVLNNERPLVVSVPLYRATVRGSLDGTRLELTVGGAMDPEAIFAQAVPLVVGLAQRARLEDPEGILDLSLRDLFDGHCDSHAHPGCDPLPPDCARDGVVTAAELHCTSFIRTLLGPDLDLDGDGLPDGLTTGYSATLGPATLVGWCGDGRVDPASGERCEAGQLGGQSCASLGLGTTGTLGCAGCALATDGCGPACGDGLCHPVERATDCPADCGAVALGAGSAHTCAVRRDGRLACWGDNAAGQVQPSGPGAPVWVPSRVAEVRDASAVALGEAHTCALLQDGTVWCFGDNTHGQLGPETSGAFEPPVRVPLAAPAAHLAAGGRHSCAVLEGGDLYCWGDNRRGQLAHSLIIHSARPLRVGGLLAVEEVALGQEHTCARASSGEVWCWGDNAEGQLGSGLATTSASPLEVQLPAPAIDLAAGWAHTCAALADGTAWCWGAGAAGQLGDGEQQSASQPVPVYDFMGVTALEAGRDHTCALAAEQGLACWGRNADGELGDGGRQQSLVPRVVPDLGSPQALSLGERHCCVLGPDAALRCWGGNWHGQTGRGFDTERIQTTPALVQGF